MKKRSKKMDSTIDLSKITDDGRIPFLSGKNKGLEARKQLGLQEYDDKHEQVKVNFPENLDCNESFLGGLFSNSISILGSRSAFLSLYNIVGMTEDVRGRLNSVITATLSEGTSLSKLRK